MLKTKFKRRKAKAVPYPRQQGGVALLEVMMAILIFSFGILGVIGLQASMIKNSAEARYRAEASFVAQKRISEIWANPNNLANFAEASPGTDISKITSLPNGKRITERGGANCNNSLNSFCVTVTWQQAGDSKHSVRMVARI